MDYTEILFYPEYDSHPVVAQPPRRYRQSLHTILAAIVNIAVILSVIPIYHTSSNRSSSFQVPVSDSLPVLSPSSPSPANAAFRFQGDHQWPLAPYTSPKPYLACNPEILTPLSGLEHVWGSTAGLSPGPSPSTCGDGAHQFSYMNLSTNILEISESCPGLVTMTISDGHSVGPSVNLSTPTSLQLTRQHQQIILKCLELDQVDMHMRVFLPDPLPLSAGVRGEVVGHLPYRPSVILIMVDSVSRPQFIRQFPETVKVLESIGGPDLEHEQQNRHRHRILSFSRFSTGGIGTAGNFVPTLTGIPSRLYRNNHDLMDQGNVSRVQRHVDQENLFMVFKRHGYLTSLMDESGPLWTSSLIKYIVSPIATADEIMAVIRVLADWAFYALVDPMLRTAASFDPRHLYSDSGIDALCVGRSSIEEIEFDRIEQMITVSNEHNLPLLSISSLNTGHEPRARRAASLDKPLSVFVERVLERDPKMVLVLMSDHGIGYGSYAASDIGIFEYKLPFLFMAIPDALQLADEQIRNGVANQDRLMFPQDIYKTLSWIAGPDPTNAQNLFTERIPTWRNCSSVIGPEYDVDYKACACMVRRQLNQALYRVFVHRIIWFVNEVARISPSCEQVRLSWPGAYQVEGLNQDVNDGHMVSDDRIAIRLWVTSDSVATNRGGTSLNGSEIFTGYLLRQRADPDPEIDIELGQGWNDDQRIFTGPTRIVDIAIGAPVHALLKTRPGASPRTLPPQSQMATLSIYDNAVAPSGRRFRPFSLSSAYSRANVRLDPARSQFILWPLDVGMATGQYTVALEYRGHVLAQSSFLVVDSSADDLGGVPYELIGSIWKLDTVRRETEFGQYEKCSRSSIALPYCLCNISQQSS